MVLLLQLNGDLPEWFPHHDRRLYIFTCKAKTCRRKEGSIRAIRAVKLVAQSTNEKPVPQEDKPEKKPVQDLGNMLFNSGPRQQIYQNANPFSVSTSRAPNPFSPSTVENPFKSPGPLSKSPSPASNPPIAASNLSETFAQKVRLSSSSPPPSPSEPWPPLSDFPPPYPSYHLDADFEFLDTPILPSSSARPMEIDDSPAAARKDEDADAFESPSLDKAFRRFADRLAQNPLQVLRYEFAGSPLLYSKSDAVGKILTPHQSIQSIANKKITTVATQSAIPRCPNCNAPRVFELQLTPQAIAEVEAEEVGLEGMEWGNVILGVCSADCMPRGIEIGQVGYSEEWVGVQWEEMGAAEPWRRR